MLRTVNTKGPIVSCGLKVFCVTPASTWQCVMETPLCSTSTVRVSLLTGDLRSCLIHQGQKDCRYCKPKAVSVNLQPHKVEKKVIYAFDAFEWIDGHFFLPDYTICPQTKLHPASQQWVELPIWAPGSPCDTLVVYMDGSYISQNVAAFASFKGVVSGRDDLGKIEQSRLIRS